MDKQLNLIDYYNFKVLDSYSDKVLLREWQLIKEQNYGYESHSSWNKLIKQFQFKEFYKMELKLWEENNFYQGLPLRSWIYANRKKYIGKGYGGLSQAEVLRAFKISGIYIGYSFHSPFYIKQFIKDYSIKSIYDPCGGWGHRLLGACAASCKYIYNDINLATMQNCTKLAKYLDLQNVSFNYKDAASFTPIDNYEAVFTCPPYYNTELYSKCGAENLSYKDFLQWWKYVVTKSCIDKSSCKYFAFIINHVYEEDMLKICLDLGLFLINSHILGSSRASGHLLFNKHQQKYEKLLILSKTNE